MLSDFSDFKKLLANPHLCIFKKKGFNKVILNYNLISDIRNINQQQISKILTDSQLLIISQDIKYNQNMHCNYFYIGFENTIIILDISQKSFFNEILYTYCKLPICILGDSDKIISDLEIYEYYKKYQIKADNVFYEEIKNFEKNLGKKLQNTKINQLWKLISPCIIGYLIKKSYFQIDYDRFKNFISYKNNFQQSEYLREDDYIELRVLGVGSIFKVNLIYIIEKRELKAMKNPNSIDNEITKLISREKSNYMKIKHPLIPQFYGIVKYENYLVFEFINGKNLTYIDNIQLNEKDLITIIFELILLVFYFHSENIIIRDLKKNNLMIDINKNLIMIDFDRAIEYNNDNKNSTIEIIHECIAPEINKGSNFTFKSDIYSLGITILNILSKRKMKTDFAMIEEICKNCTNKNPEMRPLIFDILKEYYLKFQDKITIDLASYGHLFDIEIDDPNNKSIKINFNRVFAYCTFAADQNIPKAQFYLGQIYFNCEFVSQDINKAMNYLFHAAKNNNPDAQFVLGFIYQKGEYAVRNINKAINYYDPTAKQNHPKAQFNLGQIYHTGPLVKRDIKKAIQYYELASKQNHLEAQLYLGRIYESGIDGIQQDIDKAIYYYKLASDQNNSNAQLYLGHIYYSRACVKRDIKQAIHYYELAANQNVSDAQFYLGQIYFNGYDVQRDIKKAIHYFKLAAGLNNPRAQFYLGQIYDNGDYFKRNINKAIHYYKLAANQNEPDALYNLGVIYNDGKLGSRDAKKAFYYFERAARKNIPEAFFNLGSMYYHGDHIPCDIEKAIQLFERASELKLLQAQFALGGIYYDGLDTKQDINKAIYYYTLAANQCDSKAQFNIGYIYYTGKYVKRNMDIAIHYLKLSAKQNNSKAQYCLGVIYYNGNYVTRDIYRAIDYFKLAANQKIPEAQFCLGLIYNEGKYIKPDIQKAIYYYSMAADQNHKKAQYALGTIFLKGEYVLHDIKKAIYHYKLAADQNDPIAQYTLGLIYYQGKYGFEDIKKGIHYLQLSADQNYSRAQYMIGNIYYNNNSGDINQIQQGQQYIFKSLINDYKLAYFVSGFIYHEGRTVKRDINRSIQYYKEASSFNITYAQNNLGIIYKNGFGTEIKANTGKAIEYFENAIKKGYDSIAKYNLANIYLYDINDINKSIDLLIDSYNGCSRSIILLSLALIKKHGFNLEIIQQEENIRIPNNLFTVIKNIITQSNMLNKSSFNKIFEKYRKIDFLYDSKGSYFYSFYLYDNEKKKNNLLNPNLKNISSDFYDGFGLNI